MPCLRFVDPSGSEVVVQAGAGTSVMLAAIHNNVPGIEAECGGSLNCATCHVYVDVPFLQKLDPPSELETELLAIVAAERRPNSRLSCQIAITDALDGLSVSIPERQL